MTRPLPQSFLLRMWRERNDMSWRITLIAVTRPDDPHHFETLEACFSWLQEHTTGTGGLSTDLSGNTSIVTQIDAAEK